MEKTKDAVVVPLDAGWSDIGSWSSLWGISKKDVKNRVIISPFQNVDCFYQVVTKIKNVHFFKLF